jgi:hypothetical protein
VKVSVRSTRDKGIVIKRLGRESQSHKAGTVVMKSVTFGRSMLGEVIEENENAIMPRSQDMLAIRNWPTARYIARLGCYIDTDTHERVTSANFVYAVGSKIYYW